MRLNIAPVKNWQQRASLRQLQRVMLKRAGYDINRDKKDRAAMMSAAENGLLTCRICLDDECKREDVIAPCSCSGSAKWVHRACLDQWRSTREDKAFSKCTECLKEYELYCPDRDDNKFLRRLRFTMYICRDLSLLLVATQVYVAILSLSVYGADKRAHFSMLNGAHMELHPKTFYYLFGLSIALASVGLMFMCFSMTGRAPSAPIVCQNTCDCCIYSNFYVADSSGTGACCECCANPAACSCGECAGGSAVGHELAICFLVIFVILALVGVFVSVVLGAVYFQYLIQKHIKSLSKFNLTKDYIVRDLSPDAVDIALPSAPLLTETISPYSVVSSSDIELGPVGRRASSSAYNRLDESSALSPTHPPSAPSYMTSVQMQELVRMGLA